MIVLVISQFLNILCGPVGQLLVMTGHQSYVGKVVIFTTSLNLLTCIIFVNTFGMYGAVFSTALNLFLWNLLLLKYISKNLSLQPSILNLLK